MTIRKITTIKLMTFCLIAGLYSCEKQGISDMAPSPHPTVDSTTDIKAALSKSSFILFRRAASRCGLDSLLVPQEYFTIFAPTDAAMQAAGFTQSYIDGLQMDSLKKMVLYHVVHGVYSNSALSSTLVSIQTNTLRQDIFPGRNGSGNLVYQQLLFLKKQGGLFINGEPAGGSGDTALSSSNGCIWPVNRVLQAPGQSLWEVIRSRPELSLYLAALRINDSIYASKGYLGDNVPDYMKACGDSIQFSRLNFANLSTPKLNVNPGALLTMMAPTNAAFQAAGFNTPDDIRAYAGRTAPSIGFGSVFLSMDSVLKLHLLCTGSNTFSNLGLYCDMLQNPYFNNGIFNAWSPAAFANLSYGVIQQPFLLQLGQSGANVQIRWSVDPAMPQVILPADGSRHIMAQNGVLYEIDRLFYPHN